MQVRVRVRVCVCAWFFSLGLAGGSMVMYGFFGRGTFNWGIGARGCPARLWGSRV